MRKTKTIKIDDREITVRELRVKDIRMVMEKAGDLAAGFANLPEILPLASDISVSDLEEMAPSELETVWGAFKEVNSVFFNLAVKSGIPQMMKDSLLTDLTATYAGLLKEATEPSEITR